MTGRELEFEGRHFRPNRSFRRTRVRGNRGFGGPYPNRSAGTSGRRKGHTLSRATAVDRTRPAAFSNGG